METNFQGGIEMVGHCNCNCGKQPKISKWTYIRIREGKCKLCRECAREMSVEDRNCFCCGRQLSVKPKYSKARRNNNGDKKRI